MSESTTIHHKGPQRELHRAASDDFNLMQFRTKRGSKYRSMPVTSY